jgi:uncharacterized phage protein gp47/JayE
MATTDLFRSRDELLAEMQDALVGRIPDAHLAAEGLFNIILSVMAGVDESVFLALQVVSDDQFIETASPDALDRHGFEYGVPRLGGTPATGTLKFTGAGATAIGIGAEVAYDAGTGDEPLYFLTIAAGTIPNPGVATAPTAAVGSATGQTGTYEYAVSFVTAAGETMIGAISSPVVLANQKGAISAIPVGGPGTTARKLYRQKDGAGGFKLVTTIADNTTTVFTDNVADGSVTVAAPTVDTALSITLAATAEESGADYNVLPGSIAVLTDVPDGITDVTNTGSFSGGTDPESTEDYRVRLGKAVKSPGSGSPTDLKSWAEAVPGVDSATVFINDNVGVSTPGHTTVRISGPNGAVPASDVIDATLAALQVRDIGNITLHVATFTATPTDVNLTVTPASGYLLADISAAVTSATQDYINGLLVGETYKLAGNVTAVFSLPGVADVVITSPATNLATGATAKRTPGTIVVS